MRIRALLAALAWTGVARASAFDVVGFGPEGVAQAGARVARADDGSAAFYNPGGLALARGYRLELGSMLQLSRLEAQGRRQSFDHPLGGTLAFSSDVPLEGPLAGRLRVGFAGYFLPDALLALQSRARSEPFFPYYANRTERLVAIPALAVRVTDWLGVGAGIDVLAGLHGPAEVREGASPGLETRVDQEATTVLRALAGARARAGAWRFGAVYRGKFASSNGLRTTSTVGGVPLVVAIDLKEAFFAPETWSAGASWAPGDGLELEIDAAWLRWSQWRGPVMTIDAVLPGVTIRSRPDAELWRDTWTVRGAGSLRFDLGSAARLAVSAGAGYEPSIQKPLQQGETNQVDGDKLIVGLGARLELPSLVSMPLSIGVGAQGQTVGAYRQDKEVCTVPKACSDEQVFGPEGEDPSAGVTNPGYPTLEGSGSVWALALGVQVEL